MVGRSGVLGLLVFAADDQVDLGGREAGELDAEVELDQRLELGRQDLARPAGLGGELVVGDDVGPALSLAEVREAEARDLGEAEQLCCFDSAVAGDDLALVRDQDRVGEAELSDGIAAEKTGRRGRAIEYEPKFVDVGVRRWQAFTGKRATLGATGQTFEEVEAERLASAAA